MLIGGGSWGLVSWAIAYAAWDVEKELAEEEETEQALSARAESEREG
jgi:streptomycin 6-kinase